MKNIFSSFLFFGSFMIMKAQTPLTMTTNENYIQGNYQLLPSVGDVEIRYTSLFLNMQKSYRTDKLIFGLTYENIEYIFKDNKESYLFGSFENSHLLSLSGTYVKSLKNNWNVHLQVVPQISSTLKNTLQSNDVLVTGSIHFGKIWTSNLTTDNSKLIVGLNYDTLFGEPRLYPLISYSSYIRDDWEFTIGLPISSLNYTINSRKNINFSIRPKSSYTNHSGTISLNEQHFYVNNKLEFSSLSLGLDYYMKFNDYWTTSFGIGYLPVTSLKVLDMDNTTIYDFDSADSISINFGLKFNLNKNK